MIRKKYTIYIIRYCMSWLLFKGLLATSFVVLASDHNDLTELSLEDLMNVEVTSVSRHAEALMDSSAAVDVISYQDIIRSGATSIPEALRLVPGMTVAQIDSSKWMVGARSFASRFSNNLQVMVDGRSIYTPAYNGVYWEQLDIVMEDIERIEVIRGPGSTLWGANAVNGVINIITKSASDTLGSYFIGRAGNIITDSTLRYGAKLGDSVYGRAYVKRKKRDAQLLSTGQDSYDAQINKQAGFRLDSNLMTGDKLILQGDIYNVESQQIEEIPIVSLPCFLDVKNTRKSKGWNIKGQWEKPLSLTSDMSLQIYADYYSVNELALSPHDNLTLDIDFQHHKTFSEYNNLIWGINYYTSRTDIESTNASVAMKDNVKRYRLSAFIQDEISLIKDTLTLTVGTKIERNSVTGVEYQPNVRILFKNSSDQSIWGAISRSVRVPSIGEELIRLNLVTIPPFAYTPDQLPIPIGITSVPDLSNFNSEEIISYELGYRNQLNPSLSIDTSLYYTSYNKMRGANLLARVLYPSPQAPEYLLALLELTNENKAIGRGIEISTKWQATNNLRLTLNYTFTHHSIPTRDGLEPDSSPRHNLSLRSILDINPSINIDTWLQYTSRTIVEGFIGQTLNNGVNVPGYWNMNMKFAWQASDKVKLSLVGKNLLHKAHLEGANPTFNNQVVEISRSIFGEFEWRF